MLREGRVAFPALTFGCQFVWPQFGWPQFGWPQFG